MINEGQLRAYIIRPALEALDLYSKSAEELLVLTIAAETAGGSFIMQVGGPAIGIFQMEPATHDDIWASHLSRNVPLIYKMLQKLAIPTRPKAESMMYNLMYAAMMARIFYYRFPEALPDASSKTKLAEYYKTYWNTDKGSATVKGAIASYNKYRGITKK